MEKYEPPEYDLFFQFLILGYEHAPPSPYTAEPFQFLILGYLWGGTRGRRTKTHVFQFLILGYRRGGASAGVWKKDFQFLILGYPSVQTKVLRNIPSTFNSSF